MATNQPAPRPLTATERKELKQVIDNEFDFIRADVTEAALKLRAEINKELTDKYHKENKKHLDKYKKLSTDLQSLSIQKSSEHRLIDNEIEKLNDKKRAISVKYQDKETDLKLSMQEVSQEMSDKGFQITGSAETGWRLIIGNLNVEVSEEFDKRYPLYSGFMSRIRRDANEAHKKLLIENVTSANVKNMLDSLPNTQTVLGLSSEKLKELAE